MIHLRGLTMMELEHATEADGDTCPAPYPPQPDTCLREQHVETEVTMGGDPGMVYEVRLRVRGLFEPTTISGASRRYRRPPTFKVGGRVLAADYSQWHIEVSSPSRSYWLNHYASTSHTIYAEDFETTIRISAPG